MPSRWSWRSTTQPREVTVPEDLSVALAGDAAAGAFFETLSYSNKLRHVLSITDAKTPETRRSGSTRPWRCFGPARNEKGAERPFIRVLTAGSVIADMLGKLADDHGPEAELGIEIFGGHALYQVEVHLDAGVLVLVEIGAAEALVEVPVVDVLEASA